MAFQDRTLTCRECESEFVFSASEQEFYAEKGFENDPVRCPECRAARKRQQQGGSRTREMFDVVCSECGTQTQVPFKPVGDRPIYCRDCFQRQKSY